MSVHLTSVPQYMKVQMNNAIPIEFYDGRKFKGFPVRASTEVDDFDLMQKILKTSTLGFKSKRELLEFTNRCGMVFSEQGFVVITFMGNFKKNEVKKFVSGLNREFKKIKKQQYKEEQRKRKLEQKEREKKLKQEFEEEQRRLKREQKEKEKEKRLNDKLIKEHDELEKQMKELYDELDKIETNNETKINITIPSNLTDITLINKVLEETYVGFSTKSELESFQNKGQIFIKKSPSNTYDFIFEGDYNEKEALNYVNNLFEEYTSLVQEQTYLKVLEKIKKENLSLESEIIDNQDSIVLTINV